MCNVLTTVCKYFIISAELSASVNYTRESVAALIQMPVLSYVLNYFFGKRIFQSCFSLRTHIKCALKNSFHLTYNCNNYMLQYPNVASYQSMCMTCTISKLFERTVLKKSMEFAVINSILSVKEHGFTSKKSTATNRFCCVNGWTDMLDIKNYVAVVSLLYLGQLFEILFHFVS